MEPDRRQEIAALEMIGGFIGIFGLIVIAAVLIPQTATGRLANLICGSIFAGIGIGTFIAGRRIRRRSAQAGGSDMERDPDPDRGGRNAPPPGNTGET